MTTPITGLEYAVSTDPGRVRTNNEDSVFADPEIGLAIVADGMGGSNAGEVASAMAATLVSSDLKEMLASRANGDARASMVVEQSIGFANGSIFRAAER